MSTVHRDGKLNPGTMEEIEKEGLNLLGVVPHDETVYEYDCDGKRQLRFRLIPR